MKTVQAGDTVRNPKGWQGRVEQISPSRRFGTLALVEYASRREWENVSSLEVVSKEKE